MGWPFVFKHEDISKRIIHQPKYRVFFYNVLLIRSISGEKRRLSDSVESSPVKKHQTQPHGTGLTKQTTLQKQPVSSSTSRDTGVSSRDSSSIVSHVSAELRTFLLGKLECGAADGTASGNHGNTSPWIIAKDLIVRNSATKGEI